MQEWLNWRPRSKIVSIFSKTIPYPTRLSSIGRKFLLGNAGTLPTCRQGKIPTNKVREVHSANSVDRGTSTSTMSAKEASAKMKYRMQRSTLRTIIVMLEVELLDYNMKIKLN